MLTTILWCLSETAYTRLPNIGCNVGGEKHRSHSVVFARNDQKQHNYGFLFKSHVKQNSAQWVCGGRSFLLWRSTPRSAMSLLWHLAWSTGWKLDRHTWVIVANRSTRTCTSGTGPPLTPHSFPEGSILRELLRVHPTTLTALRSSQTRSEVWFIVSQKITTLKETFYTTFQVLVSSQS